MSENNEAITYSLPEKSLPGFDLRTHIEDLKDIIEFIDGCGIKTNNTRLSRYLKYWTECSSSNCEPESVFKNVKDDRFKSDWDWHLYVLRETHELMWIVKGLRKHIPKGIDEKLKHVVSGKDFAALDSNSLSRNTQFELRIASYFCQSGYSVDMSTQTDIIAYDRKFAFYVECKRVASVQHFEDRLKEARDQLVSKMPRRHMGRICTGHIAIDVTKIAFEHNGLTFGMTNEHSRDVIQNKLKEIAGTHDFEPIFNKSKNLHQLWFQIHIPSLIRYPPMPTTRFSSYFVSREYLDGKGVRALKAFIKLFKSCSEDDTRSHPPENLKIRSNVILPKGTIFSLDEEPFDQFISTGELKAKSPDSCIARLEIDGREDEFSFMELEQACSSFSEEERAELTKKADRMEARMRIVIKLYFLRYPYVQDDEEAVDAELVERISAMPLQAKRI